MKKILTVCIAAIIFIACNKEDSRPVTKEYSAVVKYHLHNATYPDVDTMYTSTLMTIEKGDTMTVHFFNKNGQNLQLSQ